MDAKRQARASQQHIRFAEDWMVRSEDKDRWRRLQSRIGRSRFQTTMLSHRPWECRDPDQDPPTCNAQVLEYFRTMVSRFLSHRQWRRQFIQYYDDVPDKDEWLPAYWDSYLRARIPSDPWSAFGPLCPYLRYEEMAAKCFKLSAELPPPNHEVRDWKPFEELMEEQEPFSPVFWNPVNIL